MSNIIKELHEKGLTNLGGHHHWMPDNIHYITMMGSVAYGVSSDTSDTDIYSFCIPKLDNLFPHLKGELVGFGDAKNGNNRFRNFQEHHIKDVGAEKEYDINVYNIVDYFQLVMENNPNMIDSLFTPQFCVLHSTRVGQMVRENRKMFLHLGSWHTFRGYSYAQLHKCGSQNRVGKRKEVVEEMGYDPKFAYHIVRLLGQIEQILTEGDLDLQRNREQLKAIRRGEWSLNQIKEYFTLKEIELEVLYNKNKPGLPWGPKDQGLQDRVKQLLLQCLEEHYGSLDKYIVNVDAATVALREIDQLLTKFRDIL
jgi:predicted nucleotidyltransferase